MFCCTYKGKSITAISDTHENHRALHIPETDILIHCGDACTDGNEEQLTDFFQWFSQQPAKHKIFVAGNHDLPFDLEPEEVLELLPKNVRYLENSGLTLEGISFFSVVARPWMYDVPEVPKNLDFLLTHGPAKDVLDMGLGCQKLRKLLQKTKPVYHFFGHIHETAEQSMKLGGIHCVNVIPKEDASYSAE